MHKKSTLQSALFLKNLLEKGRRADNNYQPEYYEKNLISMYSNFLFYGYMVTCKDEEIMFIV